MSGMGKIEPRGFAALHLPSSTKAASGSSSINACKFSCSKKTLTSFQGVRHVTDETLTLKKIVLPPRNLLTLAGFEESIKNWAQLESMTMPLAFFGFEMVKSDRSSLAAWWRRKPWFTILYLLNNMKNLEVLTLCHCLIVDEGVPGPGIYMRMQHMNLIVMSIMERASGMKNFLVCNSRLPNIGIWRRDMVMSTLAAY